MVGIKWVGAVYDNSGYANATRDYIFALQKKGVTLVVKPHCFERNQVPFGSHSDMLAMNALVNSDAQYDTLVIQLTPDMAALHIEPSKRNIGYFAWETTKVHPEWVEHLNKMDEVWVPSGWNVSALKSSGVTVPIKKVPHGIDLEKFDVVDEDNISIPGVTADTYVFYSIFQWNVRKNPETLLRVYFNTFSKDDDVVLVLKTYLANGSDTEHQYLRDQIVKVKNDMMLSSYPRVILIPNILSNDQIKALHTKSDCFVSLHHGEGWGLGMFDAGLAGNPVIATGMGGNMEFMDENNSYPVSYSWSYVRGMTTFNRWYVGNGMWGEPDDVDASEKMRYVFNNRLDAKQKAQKLRIFIKNNFSWSKVADTIISYL